MCGIYGIIGPTAGQHLEKARSLLAHRGPDGSGCFLDEAAGVGLVHTRLSILDTTECAAQPMTDSARNATIVFNGEIYNYKELRDQLKDSYQFRSTGDTEVLLAAYLRWGAGMLPKLNGIFAFALYDHRDRSVLLARDGLGVKPLYLTQARGHFAFASELKALLSLPGLDRTVDLQGISHYLTYLYSPGEATAFKSVKKMLPGHAMLLRDGVPSRVWRFYELPYEFPVQPFTEAGAVDELRDRLDTAVRRQMVSDVPLGAFLSGGLDSSSICSFARHHAAGGKLDCFTIDFTGPGLASEGLTDDLPYARKVAHHLGVKLHTVTVAPDTAVNLEKLVWQLDEPQADPAALNTFFICQMARSQGITVLLSGAGGDDIFTGYRRHRALVSERYWDWMPLPARQALAGLSNLAPRRRPWGRRLSKAFRQAASPSRERLLGYFQWMEPEVLASLWSSDIRAMRRQPDSNKVFRDALESLTPGVPQLNQMLYLEAKYFLCDHNLNYTDKMSMAAGVEVRVPFLDPDLVSFATRLPLDFKQRGAEGKWIFKRAMERDLPRDVIYRPKTGFGVPLRLWLGSCFNQIMGDYLSPETLRRRGLFDPAAVIRLIEDDRAGRVDAAYSILALACIEIWCRQFADSPSSQG